MYGPKGYGFNCFGHKYIGYEFWPFWSQIGYGFFTLVLNLVCFLEEFTGTFFFIINKAINKSPSQCLYWSQLGKAGQVLNRVSNIWSSHL